MSCTEKNSRLSSKVELFNAQADDHKQKQAVNPFSRDSLTDITKPHFSKEEYGRPAKGSLSETRGFRASAHVYKEMLELCEIIHDYGEPLYTPTGKDDTKRVISFGDLFNMYTVISNKLVGVLLRARKHDYLNFEGECLFQGRDNAVPVVLLKPIEAIRQEYTEKVDSIAATVESHKNSERQSGDHQPE